MKIQKKVNILTAFCLCVLLLAGCANMPHRVPKSTGDTSEPDTADATQIPESGSPAEAQFAALQGKIREAGCTVGIAFVDYIEEALSPADARACLLHSETVAAYPFMSDIRTVAYTGTGLFVLVPASESGVITVFPLVINDQGEVVGQQDQVICQSAPGEPIALRCNMSDTYADVLISVTDGQSTCSFSPMLSLKDGWSVVPQDGCHNFSIDRIQKYADDIYTALSKKYSEIRETLDNGGSLISAGDFYFKDQWMLRFELGHNTEHGFVCERQYAVSFDTTYTRGAAESDWYVIGAGLWGMEQDDETDQA